MHAIPHIAAAHSDSEAPEASQAQIAGAFLLLGRHLTERLLDELPTEALQSLAQAPEGSRMVLELLSGAMGSEPPHLRLLIEHEGRRLLITQVRFVPSGTH